MPVFSFATTYTAIITSSFLLFLILLLCQDQFIQKAGYLTIFFLSCLTLLRLAVPLEFPFTITKPLPFSVSYVVSRFRVPLAETEFITLSLWNILEIIWGMGSGISLLWNISQNWKIRRYVFRYGRDMTENAAYAPLLEQVCLTEKRPNHFRIYELPGLQIPAIWMNHRTPYILLPDHLCLSPKDMRFIFRHEMAHYFHGDFLFKGIIRLICIIYWWNPVCMILKRRTDMLLEMRVDHYATGKDIAVSMEYIQCLIHILQNTSAQPDNTPKLSCPTTTIPFASVNAGDLGKRANMLLYAPLHKKTSFTKLATISAALGIYILSYLYIPEAYYLRPEIQENSYIIFTSENTCIIQTDTNNYDVYYQGKYYTSTDSLDYFDSDIKIYTLEEDSGRPP